MDNGFSNIHKISAMKAKKNIRSSFFVIEPIFFNSCLAHSGASGEDLIVGGYRMYVNKGVIRNNTIPTGAKPINHSPQVKTKEEPKVLTSRALGASAV